MTSIPKVIHYCWFGGNPLPALAEKCIASWKKYLPQYEIKRWDESNFEINIIPYTQQAYEAKKYAFVSDYARFWILYHYGGLYFDVDVEVIKPIDDIIEKGAYMGSQYPILGEDNSLGFGVNPGLGFAVVAKNPVYKEFLDFYATLAFKKTDGTLNTETIVKYTTDILTKHGLKNSKGVQQLGDITIYPPEFFCPIDYDKRKIHITENTRTIHHYAESWFGRKEKISKNIKKIIGRKTFFLLLDLLHKIKR